MSSLDVKSFRTRDVENAAQRMARNALTHLPANTMLVDPTRADALYETVSNELDIDTKPANQQRSGRCWIFAFLNMLRVHIIRRYDLPREFELSASYLFFWDQLEKSHQFLWYVIALRELPSDHAYMRHLLENPVSDGGQWHMLRNIVRKYGVIPQHYMQETYQTNHTRFLNDTLCGKLREFAHALRTKHRHHAKDGEPLQNVITSMMHTIYGIISRCVGEPPSTIVWEYYKTKGHAKRRAPSASKTKKYRCTKRITPIEFYQKHVVGTDTAANVDNYVCVINYPRTQRPFYRMYTLRYMNNMVGGDEPEMLNLPVRDLQLLVRRAIDDERPVWFACDVSKDSSAKLGIMDPRSFQYTALMGEPRTALCKGDRMEYRDGSPSHAMLILGYHISHPRGLSAGGGSRRGGSRRGSRRGGSRRASSRRKSDPKPSKVQDDKRGKQGKQVERWRVENSWGEVGAKKGVLMMSNEWFEEHVYSIVVPRSLVRREWGQAHRRDTIHLEPWDIFGNLFRKT